MEGGGGGVTDGEVLGGGDTGDSLELSDSELELKQGSDIF